MKVKILMLCLFVSFGIKAQTKKWTLQECVAYALENNISIQQSELDLKSVDVERLDAIGAFCLQLAPILIMGLILEQILIQQLISLKIKHSLLFRLALVLE